MDEPRIWWLLVRKPFATFRMLAQGVAMAAEFDREMNKLRAVLGDEEANRRLEGIVVKWQAELAVTPGRSLADVVGSEVDRAMWDHR